MNQQTDKVINYYRATEIDYRFLWTGRRDLAIHFGYFEKGTESHEESLLKMNEVMARHARVSRTDRVLDAGCGIGGSALWLAENIGCSVDGVTIAPFQAAKARAAAEKRTLADRARFHCLDYLSLPFPAASYDVVWGLESVLHAENKKSFIREASRLLKNKGRIVLAEYVLRESPPFNDKEKATIETWLDGWAVPNLLTAGEYRQLLGEAGFSDIKIHDVTLFVEPSLRRLKAITRITLPLARFFYALRMINKKRLENTHSSFIQYEALKKGLWKYVIVTAEKPVDFLPGNP